MQRSRVPASFRVAGHCAAVHCVVVHCVAVLCVQSMLLAQGPLDSVRDALFQARSAVASLRTGDFRLRDELSADLDAAQRTLETLNARTTAGVAPTAEELGALRDRIERARRRARSEETVTGQGLGPATVATPTTATLAPLAIPESTPARIQLLQPVYPAPSRPGELVEAVVVDPVSVAGRVVAPIGALVRGTVVIRDDGIHLAFSQIQIGYTSFLVGGGAPLPETVQRTGLLLDVVLSPAPPGRP